MAATGMPLTLLSTTLYPNALCNDGTPAGYYYQSGVNDVWVVHQQGGGWCYDEASCLARPPSLTSSSHWAATLSVDGLFAATDPRLAGAHLVYAPYCSSDAWVGGVGEADVPFKFNFRGRSIVDAIFADLAATRGLGAAPGTTVLYSGCSAGARGVLFNLGHVGQLMAAPPFAPNVARFGGLLDSAFWIDQQPLLPNITSFAAQAQGVYSLMNVSGLLAPSCTAAFPRQEGWRCLMGQYAVPYLAGVPYLLFAFQYDLFQLQSDEGVQVPTTPPQLAYAQAFRTALRAAAAADVPPADNTTAMLPACFLHCNTETPLFATLAVNGTTLQDALVSWLFQTGVVPVVVEDNCAGFNCGEGCPAPLQRTSAAHA
jgi:hypothetical protein